MSTERSHNGPEPYDLAAVTSGADGAAPKDAAPKKTQGPSQATRLVQLALAGYDLGCTPEGEPYAIPKNSPRVVRLLRGGRGSLRAELARAYYDDTETAASQSALADALAVIDGKAQRVDPVELHLRVAARDPAKSSISWSGLVLRA